MDKVKKLFSPGHKHDDEVMYENQSTSGTQDNTASSELQHGAEHSEHTVLRQVLNPNTANYDEEAFGQPAPGATGQFDSELDKTQLHTLPKAKKHEHGILRQILNPHGDNYDEQAFGTTAVAEKDFPKGPDHLETLPAAEKDEGRGILRQILNPGGANYDDQAFGTTAVTEGAADVEGTKPLTESIPVVGGPETHAEAHATAPSAATDSLPEAQPIPTSNTTTATAAETQPSESATTAFGSHFGKDATLAGAGLASGGIAAEEFKHSSQKNEPDTVVSSSTGPRAPWTKPHMDSNLPPQETTSSSRNPIAPAHGALASSSTESKYEDRFLPTGTSVVAENPQVNTAPADVVQATYTARSYPLAGATSDAVASTENSGTDAGFATGAVGGIAAGTAAGLATKSATDNTTENQTGATSGASTTPGHTLSGTTTSGITTSGTTTGTTTGTTAADTTTGAGHTSDIPHVPGEFPLETGEDVHGSHIGPATAAARVAASEPGASGFDSTRSQPSTSATLSQTSGNQHEYGRDAAIAGAATALGAGAYETSRSHGESSTSVPAPTTTNVTILGRNVEPSNLTTGHPTSTFSGQNTTATSSVPLTQEAPQTYQPAKPTTFTPDATPSQYPATPGTQQPITSTGLGTSESSSDRHFGRDAAIAGGAGAAGAGIYAASKDHGNTGPAPHTVGPHSSDFANIVDPRNQPNPSAALDETAARAQEKSHAKEVKEQEKAHAKEVKEHEKEVKKEAKAHEKAYEKELKAHEKEVKAHEKAEAKEQEKLAKQEAKEHHARDAALAGGAGAAGVGAYEAAQHHGNTNTVEGQYPSSASATTHHNTRIADQIDPNTNYQQDESHFGRNAAVAGSAGVAGIGAYEYGKGHGDASSAPNTIGQGNLANVHSEQAQSSTGGGLRSAEAGTATTVAGAGGSDISGRDHRDTGPASATIGPHSSNVLNVIDPRVQPDSSLQKEETPLTQGPHRSDIANIVDPRVQPNVELGQHTGRDAAVGGAAGAGAAGALEADHSHHSKDDTQHHEAHEEKHKHNKLQKPRPEEHSEKQSFLSRILHPGRKSAEDRETTEDQTTSPPAAATTAGGVGAATGAASSSSHHNTTGRTGQDEIRIEPHTGLPINVGKYGTGQGGTDGAPQIHGYHETDPAIRDATIGTAQGAHPGEQGVAGPDLDEIKKKNTLY